jgi:hypothetical protein
LHLKAVKQIPTFDTYETIEKWHWSSQFVFSVAGAGDGTQVLGNATHTPQHNQLFRDRK